MKITEYPSITKLTVDNVFIVDGNSGTKKIKTQDAILAQLGQISPETHRVIYRGKNLGSFSNTHRQNIQNGTFDDLWLGDYWTSGGVKYRIVDFNYFNKFGSSPTLNRNHVVVMPDSSIGTGSGNQNRMNATDRTYEGYNSAERRNRLKTSRTSKIQAAVSNTVIQHKEVIVSSVSPAEGSNGAINGSVEVTTTCELPTASMIYGQRLVTPFSGSNYSIVTEVYPQFALFMVKPEHIVSDPVTFYFLRTPAGGSQYLASNINGMVGGVNCSTYGGIRPHFIIG